jgi:mono/diheme cytochrome c family protein
VSLSLPGDAPSADTPRASTNGAIAVTLPSVVELRRAHTRGQLTLLIGLVAGAFAFLWIAGWPGRAHVAPGGTDIVSWVNGLPAARQQQLAAGARPSLVLTSENRGKVLFGRYCDSCHYAGNENIGASLRSPQFKRTFNTPAKVATFVRRGGFDMPAYSATFLSDADLDAIAEFVLALPPQPTPTAGAR